jgi:hypothetical protein
MGGGAGARFWRSRTWRPCSEHAYEQLVVEALLAEGVCRHDRRQRSRSDQLVESRPEVHTTT